MKLSKACHVICNKEKKKVVLANLDNGTWILIPLSCWRILQQMDEMNLSVEDIYKNAFNYEDEKYLRIIFEKLLAYDFLVPVDKVASTFTYNIRKISINLTYRCNLKCKHCCVDAKHVSEFTEEDELDTELLKKVLEKAVALNPEQIVLSGGEPMIRKDFIELLQYLRQRFKNKISLSTNGLLINETNIKYLNSCLDKYDISIDGIDEESCSRIRGKGVFNKVVESIKLIKKHGDKEIYLSMMFDDFNENLREDFLKLCKKMDVHPLMRAFEPMGRGAENWKEFEKDGKEHHAEQYSEENLKEARDNLMCFNCAAGRKEIMINPKGDIFPCGNLNTREFCMGNILEIDNIKGFFGMNFTDMQHCNTGLHMLEQSYPYNFHECKECNVNLFCWSCVSGIRNRYADPIRFKEECRDKKAILEKVVWGE